MASGSMSAREPVLNTLQQTPQHVSPKLGVLYLEFEMLSTWTKASSSDFMAYSVCFTEQPGSGRHG